MSDELEPTLEFHGLDELAQTLERDLPEAIAKRAIRNSLRAGAAVVESAFRLSASRHHRTGELEEDIGAVVRAGNDSKGLDGYAVIGPLYKGRGRNDPGITGSFVETGHAPPGKAKEKREARRRHFAMEFGGKDTPAHPWARPAWESSKDAALAAMLEKLGEEIEIACKEVAK